MKEFSRYIFFIFILTAVYAVQGQSVKWSMPMNDEKKLPYIKILGASDNGYYLLRSNMSFSDEKSRSGFKSRRYELQYYDNDLRLRWSQPVSPGCENCRVADMGLAGSKAMLLYTHFDKANKLLRLLAQKFEEDGKPSGQSTVLMEMHAEKVDESNQPDLIVSHDKHLMACSFRSVTKDKEEQLYSTVVFDTSLSVVYRKEIPVHIKEKRFGPINSILTDEGNFFLLGIEYTTEKRVKKPGESFYRLFSYNKKTDTLVSNEIKVENKFLTDVGISADNLNRKIVVAGFYSEKTMSSIAGVFYYSLNEDTMLATPVVTSAFSSDFLRKSYMDRTANDSKELSNYSIDRIVLRKDGGAAIIAESFYTTTQSYWDYYMQMWVYHYYYHFGNIISLSINPGGSVLWSNMITKDQNSSDDEGYYSSYYSAIINGKILAIYNKHLSNPSSVLMTSISGTGKQETKILLNDLQNVMVVPHSAKQVDEGTILISALKDDKPYLAKISF